MSSASCKAVLTGEGSGLMGDDSLTGDETVAGALAGEELPAATTSVLSSAATVAGTAGGMASSIFAGSSTSMASPSAPDVGAVALRRAIMSASVRRRTGGGVGSLTGSGTGSGVGSGVGSATVSFTGDATSLVAAVGSSKIVLRASLGTSGIGSSSGNPVFGIVGVRPPSIAEGGVACPAIASAKRTVEGSLAGLFCGLFMALFTGLLTGLFATSTLRTGDFGLDLNSGCVGEGGAGGDRIWRIFLTPFGLGLLPSLDCEFLIP